MIQTLSVREVRRVSPQSEPLGYWIGSLVYDDYQIVDMFIVIKTKQNSYQYNIAVYVP